MNKSYVLLVRMCMYSNKRMEGMDEWGAFHNNNNYSYCFSCAKHALFKLSVSVFVQNVFGVHTVCMSVCVVCVGLQTKWKYAVVGSHLNSLSIYINRLGT